MTLLSVAARVAARTAQQQGEDLPAPAPPRVVSQEQQGQECHGQQEQQSQQQQGQQEQVGYIKHEKGKGYCVKSEKNSDWSGGCYPSKGKAEERLKQVEKFKHMKKGTATPADIAHDLRVVAARLAHSSSPSLEIVLSDLQSIASAMCGEEQQSQQQQADWKMTLEDPGGDEAIPTVEIEPGQEHQGQQEDTAKSPPGWGGVVEKMVKEHGFSKERAEALSWNQYNQGHTPHVKEK